jgi:hypothetical protein
MENLLEQNLQQTHDETADDFTKWCQEFNVSILANKNSEFTVLIGDSIKYVTLNH